MKDYETLDLGDVKLLSGKILKSTKITYKTYGTLNKNSDNVIVLPTFYTGTHKRNEGFFGPGRAIDPSKYFIVSILKSSFPYSEISNVFLYLSFRICFIIGYK